MKITLKDGTNLNCLAVASSVDYVRGVNRNCIALSFDVNELSSDTLRELFKDNTKTESIIISYDNTNTYEYANYTIFNCMTVTENVATVNMCQLSCFEKQEQERIEQLNALSEVVADMLGGAL